MTAPVFYRASVTWNETPEVTYVGCYAPVYSSPVYGPLSPTTYYSPADPVVRPAPDEDNEGSLGTEDVRNVPQVDPFGSGYELEGVLVWFEWGRFVWSSEFNRWGWHCDGATDWYWLQVVGSCFAGGTHLLTPTGSKPIEQFKAGDLILSSPEFDLEAPPIVRRVTEVTQCKRELIKITIRGQVVQATREHPFYVRDRGWVPAASLTAGDLLRSHDGQWVGIESIVDIEKAKAYNVCVDEHNTYFVGDCDWTFSIWVHGAAGRQEAPLVDVAWLQSMGSSFLREPLQPQR